MIKLVNYLVKKKGVPLDPESPALHTKDSGGPRNILEDASYDYDLSIASGSSHFTYPSGSGKTKINKELNFFQAQYQRFTRFWSQAPYYIWSLFVEMFYIPAYRYEWGKYSKWTCDSKKGSMKKFKETDHEFKKRKHRKGFIKERRKLARKKGIHSFDKHEGCKRIRINCSGEIFETQLRTLRTFPDTLLGDLDQRERYWNPKKNEYFFDRNAECFESIIHYYQTSGTRLERPHRVDMEAFVKEITFFGIKGKRVEELKHEMDDGTQLYNPEDMPKDLFQRKLWLLFEYASSSFQAKLFSYLSITAIITSTIAYCMDTLDMFSEDINIDVIDLKDPMYFAEAICIIFFSLEFICRFLTCPFKIIFMKSFSNIVDLVSIIPTCLELFVYLFRRTTISMHGHEIRYIQFEPGSILNVFHRILKVIRIFRLLKLSRHSMGLRILGQTLKASLQELGLLAFFLMIGVIIFSSTLYFVEGYFNPESTRSSIPGNFFWAVITMTTVGYGSDSELPKTVAGRIVGSFCAIAGVLTLSLPVPVIVANFTYFYNRSMGTNKMKKHIRKSKGWVRSCPHRTTCYENDGELITNNNNNVKRFRNRPHLSKDKRGSSMLRSNGQSQQSFKKVSGLG